jgi:hypothetical protein
VSRWWTDLVAAVSDLLPLPAALLALLAAAALTGALWYWFPAWVPRRLPHLRRPGRRLRRPHWRRPRWRLPRWRLPRWSWRWPRLRLRWPWRRRPKPTAEAAPVPEPATVEAQPELPAHALASLADRLAAQGRYAEAIRERLRAMVGNLIERGVIVHHPGWTVTELAGAAGAALPAVAAPLADAAMIFSDVWYGRRTAHAEADARMRALAGAVDEALRLRVPIRAAAGTGVGTGVDQGIRA